MEAAAPNGALPQSTQPYISCFVHTPVVVSAAALLLTPLPPPWAPLPIVLLLLLLLLLLADIDAEVCFGC